jgi:hypothetical protein
MNATSASSLGDMLWLVDPTNVADAATAGERTCVERISPVEGEGFELVWAFPVKSCFWFVAGSLFGAGKPFLVPSPAIRFAERADGVKGPKR